MTHLAKKSEGHTSTEELAEMLVRELLEGVENVLLDGGGLEVGLGRVVGDDCGREIGVVNRVVDGDGDLVSGVVVDDGT